MQVLEKYFDSAFDAPDGIKKLRELILTLAMQGKLVPQDPNDQPASELFKEIEKEKKVTSTINKKKKISVIKSNKEPYSISKNWEWVKLEDVSIKVHYGYTASANFHIKTPKLLRITDIQDNKVEWENVPGGDIEENKINQYLLANNDILIARTGGTIGKSYLIDNINLDAIFASYLIRVIPSKHINPKFLKLFIESPLYWKQLYLASSGTGQPNVNGTSLSQLDLPLPPLNEQKRIVEKINQLMALCDELEKLRQQKEAKKLIVHKSAINQLLDSKDTSNNQKGWQFISNRFNDLYTVKENVTELRSAILQLAMQGKLVPQDPNDQPASELLKEIKQEKEKLVKEGKLKQIKPISKITENEIPYELPKSWKWARLSEFAEYNGRKNISSEFIDDGVWLLELEDIEKTTSNLIYRAKYSERQSKSTKSTFEKNDVLYGKLRPYLDKVIVADQNGVCSTEIVPIVPYKKVDSYFLRYLLKRPTFLKFVDNLMYGVKMPRLGTQDAINSIHPLPPYEEQKRIVEKINQLMALCNELENQIENSSTKQTQLLNAIMSNIGK